MISQRGMAWSKSENYLIWDWERDWDWDWQRLGVCMGGALMSKDIIQQQQLSVYLSVRLLSIYIIPDIMLISGLGNTPSLPSRIRLTYLSTSFFPWSQHKLRSNHHWICVMMFWPIYSNIILLFCTSLSTALHNSLSLSLFSLEMAFNKCFRQTDMERSQLWILRTWNLIRSVAEWMQKQRRVQHPKISSINNSDRSELK